LEINDKHITVLPCESAVFADGKQLNEDLYGFNLGYKITFREL
jgi:hypothetical protein